MAKRRQPQPLHYYHNVSVLLPDGRVFATGGAGGGSLFGDDNSIEAYEPPYLFRGVRPRIDSISTTDLTVGGTFSMEVSFTRAVTKVVLISTRAATHWVDAGAQRFLSLGFKRTGSRIDAQIPNDAVQAIPGYYMVFALVDDIPSAGRIVRLTNSPATPLALPTISVNATSATASESGLTGVITFTRSGSTTAPFFVSYAISGRGENGVDYAALPGYVVIPAGSSSATVMINMIDDAASEGPESVQLSANNTAAYITNGSASGTITLVDNEPIPNAPALAISRPAPGEYRLTLAGPATRAYTIESSTDLSEWEPLTQMRTDTDGVAQITDVIDTDRLFFRARSD